MKIMAVDYGDSRTGLAMCDKGEVLASPLYTINMKDFDRCLEMTAEAARENKAELIVVGNPINMNGTVGERSLRVRDFAAYLEAESGKPVHLFDERCTTMAAHRIMNLTDTRGSRRKAAVDTLSAQIILQNYMDMHRNSPEHEGEK